MRPALLHDRRFPADVVVRLVQRARTWLPCAVLTLLASAGPATAAEWLLSGDLNAHDPSIVKEEGTYQNGNWWWSPATGAGLAMKWSTDGVRWRQGLQIFTAESKPAWWTEAVPAMRPLNVWAPSVQKFRDRYWCYYSISEFGRNNAAIGLVSASGIFRGDWREDGMVLSSREGRDTYHAVDPWLAVDAGHQPWLAFGSYFDGIHLVRLDPSTMKPSEGAKHHIIARRRPDLGLEGPSVVYANGYYYLFAAIDVCCNGKDSTSKIAYGRSKAITGPYEARPNTEQVSDMLVGSLTILEKGDERWAGMGGPNVLSVGDGWILVRHGYDKNAGGAQKLRINDLYWDEDGWPTFQAPPLADQTGVVGEGLTLAAPSSISYRWQVSADNGNTWDDVVDGQTYRGARQRRLEIQISVEHHGHKYRVVTGNGSTTSNALTVSVQQNR